MSVVRPTPTAWSFRAGACRFALAVSVASLAACDSGGGSSAAPGRQAAAGTDVTTAPPTNTVAPDASASDGAEGEGAVTSSTTVAGLEGASTSPVSRPATTDRSYLRAVRSAAHPGYDRVVFEFEGGLPGFGVSYVDRPVFEDGSGRTVEVDGPAVLEVRMERAASARVSGDRVIRTYRGPSRLRPPNTPAVVEVVEAGDFEAVLRWVVGSRRLVPFTVTTLPGPSRVVVDLEHPR